MRKLAAVEILGVANAMGAIERPEISSKQCTIDAMLGYYKIMNGTKGKVGK